MHAALCRAGDEPFFLEDDAEQEPLTPSQRHAQSWIQQQALVDANTSTRRIPNLSQDLELSRLGGISPAERVFMYLQVPVLSFFRVLAAAQPHAYIREQCCTMPR